jgi:hypothetical protein
VRNGYALIHLSEIYYAGNNPLANLHVNAQDPIKSSLLPIGLLIAIEFEPAASFLGVAP